MKNSKVAYGLIIVSLFICSYGYAETEIEELKQTLEEQEKNILQEQRQVGPGNRGYIYTTGIAEVSTVEPPCVSPGPVYVASDTQDQIKALYRKATQFFNEGKLEEAKKCLEEIIELNPLHIPARSFLRRILDMQTGLSFRDGVIMGKERMLDVDKAWFPPEKDVAEERPMEIKRPVETERQRIMEERASQIISEINFTDAHLRDVLKYLSEISGINIVIDEDLFPKRVREEEVPAEVELPYARETAEAEITPVSISDRITISLTNIPLIEALKYILTAKGLRYRIDEYAIVVSTLERLAAVEMETRYYHLTAGVGIFTEFAKKVKEKELRGIAKGLEAKARITIKDVLEESGVPFPPGSKVFLDKRTGTLIVRNSPLNLVLVEDVLRILDITPFQVEIEAKFIELTQTTAQELGLEWMIKGGGFTFGNDGRQLRLDSDIAYGEFGQYTGTYGKQGFTRGLRYLSDTHSVTDKERVLTAVGDILTTGGKEGIQDPRSDILYKLTTDESSNPGGNILSISGILTEPQFRMILHALNQSGCANLLSAPKITTLNNQQAQIEVVKEIIYPTEFELTPATTNDAGTVVTQPVVTPAAWTTRDVGIVLNVTPSVGADRKTVNLTLLPEVSVLKGWNDYGIEKSAGKWNRIPILQPIFYTKNVDTNVVVHDGETVVLGGLIKEELVATEDKIPLLGDIPLIGRLFRTETEQSYKTNLLIFVTANLLTPTGERIKR